MRSEKPLRQSVSLSRRSGVSLGGHTYWAIAATGISKTPLRHAA